MSIISTHRCKAIRSRVCQVLIFYACNDSATRSRCSFRHSHPSIPPFPVETYLWSDQFSGSHSSKVILDWEEVGMDSAMRHKLVDTCSLAREHEATLSGNCSVEFFETYSRFVLVEFVMNFSGAKDMHCCWNDDVVLAAATVANICQRNVANAHMLSYFSTSSTRRETRLRSLYQMDNSKINIIVSLERNAPSTDARWWYSLSFREH